MTSTLTVDLVTLLPLLAPAVGAVLVLLVDVIAPGRVALHHGIGIAASLVGILGIVLAVNHGRPSTLCTAGPTGTCFLDLTGTGAGIAMAALFAGVVILLLTWPGRGMTLPVAGPTATALVLTAVTGASVVAGARDVASWLIGLELATLPVVGLVSLTGTRRAAHGALSFVTTSVLSFGLLAVGSALWVYASHRVTFGVGAAGAVWDDPTRRPAVVLALLFMVAGLGFKISAVPFHMWTPQAYAGAATAVTTTLATVSKLAAAAGLIAVTRMLVGVPAHQFAFVMGLVSLVTMTIGTAVALRQDDVVRLVAWSAIGQGGWILLPLVGHDGGGVAAAAAYAVAYVLASLVILAVVAIVSGGAGSGDEPGARSLAAYHGLFRRHPLVGGALALGLLSLAGLPPGVLGLVAKVTALRAVIGVHLWPLAVVAVVNVIIGLAVYLRWVAALFGEPRPDADAMTLTRPAQIALGLGALALVVTSVVPHIVLWGTALG